jgi:hypothetical protein
MHGLPTSTTTGGNPSILASDRAAFHRFLFHAHWDSADLYDLVINTHGISPKTAAALVVKASTGKEITGKKRDASRRLKNLCLDIEYDDGAITLRGTARDRPSIERCEETAVNVCHAKRVTNEICFDPRYVELLGGIQSSTAERLTGAAADRDPPHKPRFAV